MSSTPPAGAAGAPRRQLTVLGSFLASSLSACIACLFTNPMEVIKTRLQLDGEGPVKFADPFSLGPEISLGLVLFAEVGCSLLVMLGFKTRLATLPLLFTMLIAAFYAHAADPFGKKELSLLFFTLFLSILISGGGRFSFDGWRRKKR